MATPAGWTGPSISQTEERLRRHFGASAGRPCNGDATGSDAPILHQLHGSISSVQDWLPLSKLSPRESQLSSGRLANRPIHRRAPARFFTSSGMAAV